MLVEYPVPEWVKILFLLAIPAPIILTTLLAGRTCHRGYRIAGGFFLLYIAYVIILGSTGCFNKVFFPPLVLLFTTFPFAFFLFLYVAKTNFFRSFIEQVKPDKLVQVHIFRLIGVFFLILAFHDALPRWFALTAGIGDMITALTSLWVGRIIRRRKTGFKKITWIWNTFGLADILFTAISANVLTKLSIDQGIMGVDTLAMFPFYLIPALAPPLIIFLHYATYLKLKTNIS